ncbi:MAG: carboxypeptidase-like regulatory domain-containing protein [Pedobacter sp.]|nr:carboxypeptidase-like regulatory domain-containing protein [Pedobacter sp.]
MRKALLFFLFPILSFSLAHAQSFIKISGVVSDSTGSPLSQVTVAVLGQYKSTTTNASGEYLLYSKERKFSLKFGLLGYKPITLNFSEDVGASVVSNVSLAINVGELDQVNITSKQNQLSNAATINFADAKAMPSVSGNFESLLKTLPGVSTNNELSSQYSVRGGNFDENLVYLNDIEINRPILVRGGQQEGLSFINTDLVSKAKFSAGGFESKYGDKLSSVLDVKYEKPDSSQFIVGLSLLNSAISTKRKFEHGFMLIGLRYKNNSNVLLRNDEKGNYRPNFGDGQLLYQHDFSPKFSMSIFTTLNLGRFQLNPISKVTKFSTLGTKSRLDVDYDGKEIDDYRTVGTALTATYSPQSNLAIKFINSYFKTLERENYNILGSYYLSDEGVATPPVDAPVKPLGNRGIYFDFGNNHLSTSVLSSEIKVDQNFGSHVFSWGIGAQTSNSTDRLNEFNYVDSTSSTAPPKYQNVVIANNNLTISNLNSYIQDSYTISNFTDLQLGVRASYSSLSQQILISPRLLLAYRPSGDKKILRFSAGVYQQPPSYRTIRDIDGTLNLQQKAQRSYNTSLGYEYAFDALGTRLKFVAESYFKYSDYLIPYKIDNLQIKYLANRRSKGFAYGTDFSIGGEFVKDMVSYFRLSLMHANENLRSESTSQNGKPIFLGYIKRPTDQRVNFSVFFQDKLLTNPSYKVHVNAVYGSRLPIGPLQNSKYLDNFYIPAYKRVDIGFSKDFLDETSKRKPKFLAKNFSSVILFCEIFNLLNIDNTMSYHWLKDAKGTQFAVPNYLTDRQINVKLIVKFRVGSSISN